MTLANLEYSFRSVCAKAHLRAAGWSYRSAALRLGVSYQHVSYVLNGQRLSASLLEKIVSLPKAKPTAKLTKPQKH